MIELFDAGDYEPVVLPARTHVPASAPPHIRAAYDRMMSCSGVSVERTGAFSPPASPAINLLATLSGIGDRGRM